MDPLLLSGAFEQPKWKAKTMVSATIGQKWQCWDLSAACIHFFYHCDAARDRSRILVNFGRSKAVINVQIKKHVFNFLYLELCAHYGIWGDSNIISTVQCYQAVDYYKRHNCVYCFIQWNTLLNTICKAVSVVKNIFVWIVIRFQRSKRGYKKAAEGFKTKILVLK